MFRIGLLGSLSSIPLRTTPLESSTREVLVRTCSLLAIVMVIMIMIAMVIAIIIAIVIVLVVLVLRILSDASPRSVPVTASYSTSVVTSRTLHAMPHFQKC